MSVILVTGGQRSGKSVFAERLALSLCPAPVYVATAEVRDEEMQRRVDLHKQRRGQCWTTVEEPLYLSEAVRAETGSAVLVDCCTLWLSNWLAANIEMDDDQLLKLMERELSQLLSRNPSSTFIFVTNEIGLGGTSANALQRRYTDLLGLLNQMIATRSDEVYLVVSGISIKIKGQTL